MKCTEERILRPASGIAVLLLVLVAAVAAVVAIVFGAGIYEAGQGIGLALILVGSALLVSLSIISGGFRLVKPNEAIVLSLFGKYFGTIYESGFYHVNPFCGTVYPENRKDEANSVAAEASAKGQTVMVPVKKKISTKVATFVNNSQKINDKLGNPVEVGAIVIWKVVNATKAVLNIDNYVEYISNQTDSTIRNVARLYPYDLLNDDNDENDEDESIVTLRGSAQIVADQMKEELQKKVEDAGIEVIEVRLNQIAYAPEIAAAMLQRQQAIAVIAARKKIVEGAVSMVEMALERLKEDGVVSLDEERKAQMVSNLLVVLCGNKEANPVVNASSIY